METLDIQREISVVRPKLAAISPLVSKIVLIFGFGNLILGYGLLIVQIGATTRRIPIINDVLSYKVHGFIFILLGLVLLYGYLRNNWKLIKIGLIAGLFVKVAWLFCLIFLAFRGGSIALLATWMMITAIQAVTYIDFIPRLGGPKNVK